MKNLVSDIKFQKKAHINNLEARIENQADIAYSLAKSIYKNNKSKSKYEIINLIKNSISSIANKKIDLNYFIFGLDGNLLLNTIDNINEDKNFRNFLDINGKKFINDMIENETNNLKFVNYLWYKPNSSQIAKKITYSKKLKELGIIIGSGSYIEVHQAFDVNIKEKIQKQSFSNDEFMFIYKINSLNNIKQDIEQIISKNRDNTKQDLQIIQKVLIKSDYKANIFYTLNDKVIFTYFLRDFRAFVAIGFNMDNINEIVHQEKIISNKNLNKKIVYLIFVILLITFIFFIISYIFANKIARMFKKYRLKVIRNEKNYQLLFNYSNDAFIVSKLDNKSAIIRSSNDTAKKLLGYSFDLIGKDFFKFTYTLDIDALLKNRSFFGQIKIKSKEQGLRDIELNVIIYKDKEETLLFFSMRDITERINLQLDKERQQNLLIQKSKMASMGEMIGNIAHQWRQPLSQLSGLFFDIESAYDYGELDKKYMSNRIDEANDLVEYMSKTIDDFKDFYNPNTSKEQFQLHQGVVNALKIINSSLEYNNVDVTINIDKALHVKGYLNEFSQVILNILSNAKDIAHIRATKEPKVNIFSELKESKIYLYIEDNCGGIDENIQDKIFEPYFTTKFNYGTGIGLYMCKLIVEEKMNGKIYFENTEENHTRFVLVLEVSALQLL